MLIIPSIHTGVLVVGTGARTHSHTQSCLSVGTGEKKKTPLNKAALSKRIRFNQ